MIKRTMELVWHDLKTCPPSEEYNERLFISAGYHVLPVEWKNGKFYYRDTGTDMDGKEIDSSYPFIWWADIDQTTTKFFH